MWEKKIWRKSIMSSKGFKPCINRWGTWWKSMSCPKNGARYQMDLESREVMLIMCTWKLEHWKNGNEVAMLDIDSELLKGNLIFQRWRLSRVLGEHGTIEDHCSKSHNATVFHHPDHEQLCLIITNYYSTYQLLFYPPQWFCVLSATLLYSLLCLKQQ